MQIVFHSKPFESKRLLPAKKKKPDAKTRFLISEKL
jgi:hypothetical protein